MDVPGAQAAYRVLDVLAEVANHERGVSARELASLLSITLPTTHRMLNVLQDRHFVVQQGTDRLYRLGPQAQWLAGQGVDHTRLRRIAGPHLDRLRKVTGESVFLSVRDGMRVTYLVCLPSEQSLRLIGRPGHQVPLHATSQGKAILAHLPAAMQQRIIDNLELTSFTKHTITDRKALAICLERVRRDGYALSVMEHDDGVHSAAAAVLNAQQQAIAAVCAGGPAFRVTVEDLHRKIAVEVMSAAAALTRELQMP